MQMFCLFFNEISTLPVFEAKQQMTTRTIIELNQIKVEGAIYYSRESGHKHTEGRRSK